MPTERKSSGNEIYQIKVTLSRTAPPIWRRLLVPSDMTLSGLHHLLQLAMGWTDSHLHEFLFRGQSYGPTDPERGVEEAIDERKVRLNQLLTRVGAKIVYTYDFGDGWEHGIVLEKGLPVDPNMTYPLCMGGAGACPPEDCGGIGEFYNLLEASRNPRHPPARFFLPCSIRLIDSMENFLARFRSTLGENGPPKMRVRERIASSHMEDLAITVAAGDTAFP